MDSPLADGRRFAIASNPKAPRFIGISDDLTGALALGAELRAAGLAATVMPWNATPISPTAAVVFDTASRLSPPRAAADRIRRLVESLAPGPSTFVYKRIDSALRGNWSAETEAMGRVLGRPILAAAAAPTLGVEVVDGMVLHRGMPITESHYGLDDEGSTSAPLGGGLPGPIVRLSLDELRKRDPRVGSPVPSRGSVVCDGQTLSDLHAAARIVVASAPVIAVGSYGLAREIGGLVTPRSGPGVLAVCGSFKEASLAQLRVASEAGWLVVEANRFAARDGADALSSGRHVALACVHPDGPVPRRREAAATRDLTRLARSTLKLVRPAGLVMIGGELASALVGALRVTKVEPLVEPWPAAPIVELTIEGSDHLMACAKSGAQGDPWWLLHAADSIVAWNRESRLSRLGGRP